MSGIEHKVACQLCSTDAEGVGEQGTEGEVRRETVNCNELTAGCSSIFRDDEDECLRC